MTAIIKTNIDLFDVNLVTKENTHIFVSRKVNAINIGMDWKHKDEIPWSDYDIDETDMRQKTAKITTPQYLDLTTGQYCVLITSKEHENFAGIFLSDEFEYNPYTGLYTYQCQDFSRTYQGKFDLIAQNIKLHRVLQFLITHGAYPLTGKISKKIKKEWKKPLSGLRPAYQYDQEFYGSTIRFNPMTQNVTAIIRNQSWIEAIRNLVFGTGAYIDVYFDKYGVLHIEPYHKDDLFNSGLYLTTPEIASAKYKFDTTNILTGVVVQSTNTAKVGKYYGSSSLLNLDLSVFFGNLTGMISNPNQSTTNTGKSGKTATGKKSSTATKTSNPYGTKKKEVWVSMDSAGSASADKNFLNNVCKQFKKNGWKAHNMGRGPETHYRQRNKAKNGVWFMIFNGHDPGVFREVANDPWFRSPLVKNNSRSVIGMHKSPHSILKGGDRYTKVNKAWDDNYSGRDTSIKYPLKYLTNHGVPICYGKDYDASKMVAKFIAGGDNPDACGKNWKFKGTGIYK